MEKLDEVFAEFLKMRKAIKKPATEYAASLIKKDLQKLAGDDEAMKIAILEQSIKMSYQGVFPLKEEEKKKGFNW